MTTKYQNSSWQLLSNKTAWRCKLSWTKLSSPSKSKE